VWAANDGSHWLFDSVRLLPHHASNQVSSADRDTIQLEGSMLASIFEAWSDRGSTLSYDTFLGAVAQVLKDEGFDVTAVCNLFSAHEQNNQCPDYVIDVFGGPPPPGNPPPPIDRFAYALADQPANQDEYEPDTTYSFSGAGSTIKIKRSVRGRYTVTFVDLPASGPGMSSSVAVTAFGSAPISCSAGNLSTVAGSAVVSVTCWDHPRGSPPIRGSRSCSSATAGCRIRRPSWPRAANRCRRSIPSAPGPAAGGRRA
jgi:hypothetical protein